MKTFWRYNLLIALFLLSPLILIAKGMENQSLHWNSSRGYSPFKYATPQGIDINNTTDSIIYDFYRLEEQVQSFSLSFRSKSLNSNPLKSYSYITSDGKKAHVRNPFWGFCIVTDKDTLAIQIKCEEQPKENGSDAAMVIKLYCRNLPSQQTIILDKGFNLYDGDNLWNVTVNGGNIEISGGERGMKEIVSLNLNIGNLTGIGFFCGWGSHLIFSDINLEIKSLANHNCQIELLEDVDLYLKKSKDPLEGYWAIFDRELEETLIKTGGDYNLLCLKDDDGYNFVYLNGASVNENNWKPGDLKIKLTKSPFEGIYDVIWIDAMKAPMSKDIKAQTGDWDTLLIQFPYQSSKIRLRKITR